MGIFDKKNDREIEESEFNRRKQNNNDHYELRLPKPSKIMGINNRREFEKKLLKRQDQIVQLLNAIYEEIRQQPHEENEDDEDS